MEIWGQPRGKSPTVAGEKAVARGGEQSRAEWNGESRRQDLGAKYGCAGIHPGFTNYVSQ